MSLMQREKGKRFEREIAAELRERFPGAIARRSSQADHAANSDVYVTGHPLLERLWLELTDAALPADLAAETGPRAKLLQAERDCARLMNDRWPVVVWHRKGERTNWATMRLSTLVMIAGYGSGEQGGLWVAHPAAIVTLSWPELLEIARESI